MIEGLIFLKFFCLKIDCDIVANLFFRPTVFRQLLNGVFPCTARFLWEVLVEAFGHGESGF